MKTEKKQIDEASAIEIMLEIPSIIKRPVLMTEQGNIIVGFNEAEYQALVDES